jgi:putative phosphoribosyl transferase
MSRPESISPAAAPASRAQVFEWTIGPPALPAVLTVPAGVRGLVLFAHGSGSSRLSPRNRQLATRLQRDGLATLLFDLLDAGEATDRRRVFDIPLLAARLGLALAEVTAHPAVERLPVGLFGASTGAAAALWAAADHPARVQAVVSRGGRPDLAAPRLSEVRAPVLLIVGSLDHEVLQLNRQAQAALRAPSQLAVVPGATHLFEEAGTLEAAADLAAAWFVRHLVESTLPGLPSARPQ